MELEVCALCASEIKQDKEGAVTGSQLCALCASKKEVKQREGRNGVGSVRLVLL